MVLTFGALIVAEPAYLLAMKCLSFRMGAAFQDEDDIRYLLRYLNIDTYDRAVEIITRFYPQERFPKKTLYELEELLRKRQVLSTDYSAASRPI